MLKTQGLFWVDIVEYSVDRSFNNPKDDTITIEYKALQNLF